MSTGKTTYLGLHRWEPDDDFLRTEFNENSDKLDEGLELMQKEMDGEFAAVRSELTAGLSAMQTAVNGKAASSHTHNASDLTGGTLPVSRGGTGNTSVDTTPTSGSTKMVTSGGVYTALAGKAASSHTHTPASIGAAASSHNHAASNITSGTLAVARGGTGVTSMADLLTALKNAGAMKMESGTYVGANYGGDASHPTTVTCSFAPRILVITSDKLTPPVFLVKGCSSFRYLYEGTSVVMGEMTWSGNTVSWYANGSNKQATHQLNSSNYTYHYLAIG